MTIAGRGEVWTGSQLAARLVALNGVAPDPVQYVIFRSTRHADGQVIEGYEVPDEKRRLNDPALDFWLARHGLAGGERLAVAVLVIRETLDERGLIRECTFERRRGSADGPFYGDPARVDFTGAAGSVRLYRSRLDGRLSEISPAAETAPPRVRSPEQFAGEHKALERRFGENVHILDVREPLLFEDMVGLSSIVHIRTDQGREVSCGIGWHGSTPYVLEGIFPRFGMQLALLPEDTEAIEAAVRANGLIRCETRLDDRGLAVVARRKGGADLFLLRPHGGRVTLEPYTPGNKVAGADQQRWIRYAETYEGLATLDAYRDGTSDDIIVLTGDLSGRVWRHHIDSDGVETWRKVDEAAAVGPLHLEGLFPGSLAVLDAEHRDAGDEDTVLPAGMSRAVPEYSLLGKIEAYARAIAALHAAQNVVATSEADEADEWHPDALPSSLNELQEMLKSLLAHATAASVHDLAIRFREGLLKPAEARKDLDQLEARLRDELSRTRLVIIPPPRAQFLDRREPPFGTEVAERFPSVSYDLEEATLCLAYRRPTAAVFHCMKVLQRGIMLFARCADIADPMVEGQRNWRQISLLFRGADGRQFGGICNALDTVRKRWRNNALWPVDKYTEEEADLIWRALGDFMRSLATICDEHDEQPRH